jgi:hypothetical protein
MGRRECARNTSNVLGIKGILEEYEEYARSRRNVLEECARTKWKMMNPRAG